MELPQGKQRKQAPLHAVVGAALDTDASVCNRENTLECGKWAGDSEVGEPREVDPETSIASRPPCPRNATP